MKKLIVTLLAVCVLACGCAKEEPTKITPTAGPVTDTSKSDEELIKEIYEEIDESKLETTKNNYDSTVSATNISLANEEVYKENANLGGGHIKMGPDGFTFDNIGPKMQKSLENILGDLSELKFYVECSIGINHQGTISREQPPTK